MRTLQERYEGAKKEAELFEREYITARDKLAERESDIEAALYEMSRLERNLEIPERGYVRNCWRSVVGILKDGMPNK